MVFGDLKKLAESLSRKGESDAASEIESLVRSLDEDSADDGEEVGDAPVEDVAQSSDAGVAPASENEMAGMLGGSWLGEDPLKWDLSPISEGEYAGTMLDHKESLPTDVGSAAPVAEAPASDGPSWDEGSSDESSEAEEADEDDESFDDEDSDEVGEDEPESEEVEEETEEKEPTEAGMVYKAVMRLTKMANDLDAKGFSEEADYIDSILADFE